MDKLAEMIAQSKRPLLLCGGGVVRGRAEQSNLKSWLEKLDAPVAITVMGGGGFPGNHPLTTGMIGMHGSRASNRGLRRVRPAHRRGLPLLRPGGPGPGLLRQPAPRSSRSTSTARRSTRTSSPTTTSSGDAQPGAGAAQRAHPPVPPPGVEGVSVLRTRRCPLRSRRATPV